jgi:hypothetical protein
VEERIAKMELEKRVCDDCAKQLQNMKNVTDLSLEELQPDGGLTPNTA